MQKIDRLGWAAGVSALTFGLRLGVRTNDATIVERLEKAMPPGWRRAESPFADILYSLRVGAAPEGRVRNYHLLYFGMERLARTMDLDFALNVFEEHLQPRIALLASKFVFVHAGVVGWRGQAIVIPGYSRAGKSTLVAELLKLGATYASDEYAVLDGEGNVHPFARPLSLRQSEGPPLRPEATSLGARSETTPLPIGLIAFARYREGDAWKPRPLSAAHAAWEMMNCTFSARLQPENAVHAAERAVARAVRQKGFRGEASETARLLLRTIDRAIDEGTLQSR
jgi:hypothetical protein